jgi:hypothetical protein
MIFNSWQISAFTYTFTLGLKKMLHFASLTICTELAQYCVRTRLSSRDQLSRQKWADGDSKIL